MTIPTELREVISTVISVDKDATLPSRFQQVRLQPQTTQRWQGVLADATQLGIRAGIPEYKAVGTMETIPADYLLKKTTALEFKRAKSTCKVELCHGLYSRVSGLRKITNTLAVGIEAFLSGDHVLPTLGLLGCFTNSLVSATAQVDQNQASISSVQKLSSNASLSGDFSYDYRYQVPASSIGYECRLLRGHVQICVESDGRIKGLFERRLQSTTRVVLHGEVKNARGDYDIGISIDMAGRT